MCTVRLSIKISRFTSNYKLLVIMDNYDIYNSLTQDINHPNYKIRLKRVMVYTQSVSVNPTIISSHSQSVFIDTVMRCVHYNCTGFIVSIVLH